MILLTPLQQALATSPGTPAATPLTPIGSPASSVPGLSFSDVVDALNPLQHIPLVSSLYRAATGSSISTPSQLVGDTLYGAALGGGVLAFASSAVNAAVKGLTGEDIAQHVVATVSSIGSADTASSNTFSMAAASAVIAAAKGTAATPSPTPLVAIPAPADSASAATATVPQSFVTRYLRIDHTTGAYQRAQMHDTMNRKLVKMVV